MKFRIGFEKSKQKTIVENTITACNKLCDIYTENNKTSKSKAKEILKQFYEETKLDSRGVDSAAIEIRITECKDGDLEKRNYYNTKSNFKFYNKNTLKIQKIGYVKLAEETNFEQEIVSSDLNKTIKISFEAKNKYIIEIENSLMVESKKPISNDKDWDELYQYVKREIMKYKENEALPSYAVLRLKGLTEGKHMANRNVESKASYTYQHILMTFKYCKLDIMEIERRKKFNTEQQRWNYIAKIVENKIIEVVRRLDYLEEQDRVFKQKAEYIDIGSAPEASKNYVKKTKEINPNSSLNDLW